jgi:hypothetical protein
MAYSAWRFQADVKPGEANPSVTVFFGPERYVLDDEGKPTAETYVEQSTADPVAMPLSQLVTGLSNTAEMEELRRKQRTRRMAG